ncbi:MAG: hypothetical protein LBS09_04255 [Bacteroidales bacterium]|nr:hypothetical protein [Bacteroidales bacterium]
MKNVRNHPSATDLSGLNFPSFGGARRALREAFALGFLLGAVLCSCEKESNYRFAGEEMPDETVDKTDAGSYPTDGSLAFHEDFRSWKRDGYVNLMPTDDCEEDRMTTSVIMYRTEKPVKKTYGGFTVAYILQDFAVNPACGNRAGTSPDSVSTGYVALQQFIFYECGQHDSDALLLLSELPSVSVLRFSVSIGGQKSDVKGVTLWKKSDGAKSFVRVGDYLPSDPDEGEVFAVNIHEKNVQLKFVPALTGKENPVNDGINRAVRIHDIWVWSSEQ